MRALLVNPWVYDFKAFDFWNKPIGLLIVARLLKNIGFQINYIDCMDRLSPFFKTKTKTDKWGRGKYHHEVVEKPKIFKNVPRRYKRYGIPRKTFLKMISQIHKPDVVLVTSAMTYWYPGVFEAIRILKEKFPATKIILGGIYATLCEHHARANSGADVVITGAVENKLVQILKDIGFPVKKPSLNASIVPDFSLYEKLYYGVVLTSRGCPFDCTYCATKYLCPEFQSLPHDYILKQMDFFRERTNNIAFFDDALLYNKKFSKILKQIIDIKYDFDLHASNGLHCRYVDRNIAELMFQANFKTIYLSLETTNPEVQKQTGDKVSTEEFIRSVATLKEVGFKPFQIHTYILYGMPGQNHQEIIDAIQLCHSLGTHAHLCEFSPIPHTQEFKKTEFDEATDPLYHNNLFYTWYYPKAKPAVYRKIKNLLSGYLP